jgi:hypothetical protein
VTVDNSKLADWKAMQAKNRPAMAEPGLPLNGGGGGGTYRPMEERVAKLEAYVEVTRDDLKDIKVDLKTLVNTVSNLPTKQDLNAWRWQWIATAIAIIALTVGGITGGLALIAWTN